MCDECRKLEGRVAKMRQVLESFLKADAAFFNAPADSFDAAIADDDLIAARRLARQALKETE